MPTTLTREQLYERVWSVSAVQLAKELGISDVAVAKACRRHQIPKPPLGYWAKKAVGKHSKRPSLPVVVDPKLQTVTFSPLPPRVYAPPLPPPPGDLPAPSEQPPVFTDEEVGGVFQRFTAKAIDVTVPAVLRSPLPLVTATIAALRRGAKERTSGGRQETLNLVWPIREHDEVCLDIHVGRESVERAARFINTLLKTLVACGFEIDQVRDSHHRSVVLSLLHARYQVRLKELTRREPHVATAKELADKEKYSFTRIAKWDYFPNGQFCLSLANEQGNHVYRSWSDGKLRRVEEMIGEIIRGILEEVDAQRARSKREHEERRQQARAAQARYEAEQRRKEEQVRIDALVREMERWELARRLRRYMKQVKRDALVRHGYIDKGSELDVWLTWVESTANRFDPLCPQQVSPPATA